jgi:hypothetical protein
MTGFVALMAVGVSEPKVEDSFGNMVSAESHGSVRTALNEIGNALTVLFKVDHDQILEACNVLRCLWLRLEFSV